MLESSLFESSPDRSRNDGRKKPAVLAISSVVHVLIAGVLILIPLLQTQAVPPVALPPPIVSPGPQVRVIRLAAARASGRAAHPVSPAVPAMSDAVVAPTAVPDKIAYIEDAIDIGALDALQRGAGTSSGGRLGSGGLLGFLIAEVAPAAAAPPMPPSPPPPPPAPKIQVREPIRVGSTLQASLLIRQVDPIYPPLARTARVEGAVIVEARITRDGTIDSLRIISGNPLLTQSVVDAVKQWRYRPTMLNGEPLEVITTITVNFRLN